MATADDRKKRIMEHLARSTNDFLQQRSTGNSDQRKRQIMDHVNRTRG